MMDSNLRQTPCRFGRFNILIQTIAVCLLASFLASCAKKGGNKREGASLPDPGLEQQETAQDTEEVYEPLFFADYDPGAPTATVLTAAEGSDLEGSVIEVPAGSLETAARVGGDFGVSGLTPEIQGALSLTELSPVLSGPILSLAVVPAQDPLSPIKMTIPYQLKGVDRQISRLAILYQVPLVDGSGTRVGVIPYTFASFQKQFVSFEADFFGTYQVIKTTEALTSPKQAYLDASGAVLEDRTPLGNGIGEEPPQITTVDLPAGVLLELVLNGSAESDWVAGQPDLELPFRLTNRSDGPTGVLKKPILTTSDQKPYSIISDLCTDNNLEEEGSCSFTLLVSPKQNGEYTAAVSVSDGELFSQSIDIKVTASGLSVSLGLSASKLEGLDITQGLSPSESVTVALSNQGSATTDTLQPPVIVGNHPNQFEVLDDQCTGTQLAFNESCSFSVRMKASASGSYSGSISVSDGEATSDALTFSGTASGYTTDLSLSPANQTGMDINGGASPGSESVFTLSNLGGSATANLGQPVLAGQDPGNFEIVSNLCSGVSLAPGETCTFAVRPIASRDGPYQGTVALGDGLSTSLASSISGIAYGITPFVSTWDTTQVGVSGSNQITLPLKSNGSYSFLVDWGDSTQDLITAHDAAEVTHTYGSGGNYTITISGQIDGFGFSNQGDKQKLTGITSWGALKLGNSGGYFWGCSNLNLTAADIPDLSETQNLSLMFKGVSALSGDITGWDVSDVTEFTGMFEEVTAFNQNISTWDVGSALKMDAMFKGVAAFNQNISTWDVSSVTNFAGMFDGASGFDQPIGSWNVGSSTNLSAMFKGASTFNQSLSNWDVEDVTDFSHMFEDAALYDQPMNLWNTSSAVDLEKMFDGAAAFNQDLNTSGSQWDVSNVVIFSEMFRDASLFDGDISNWDVGAGTLLNGMFREAANFNQDISGWQPISATDISYLFYNASSFDQNINSWNISNVTSLRFIFRGASNFNQPLLGWSTRLANVTNFSGVFWGAAAFDQNISTWGVEGGTNFYGMFYGTTNFNQDISSWNVAAGTNFSSMFEAATAFDQNISSWVVSSGTNFSSMFAGATGFNQNIGSWTVTAGTNFSSMFASATSFDQDLSGWDVSAATDLSAMFNGVTLSTPNYSALLIAWDALTVQSGVTFDGGNSQFSAGAAATARTNLTNPGGDNWTITDGGQL